MRRHDRGAFARWPAVLAVTGPQKGPTDGGVVYFFFSHQNTSGGSTDNRPVMAGLLLVSLRFVEPEDHVWCVEPSPKAMVRGHHARCKAFGPQCR